MSRAAGSVVGQHCPLRCHHQLDGPGSIGARCSAQPVPILRVKQGTHCAARLLALKPAPGLLCRGHSAQPCTAHHHRCPTMHRPSARHSGCSIDNLPSSILKQKRTSCICPTVAGDCNCHIPDPLHAWSCAHQMPSLHCHCIGRRSSKPAPH